jgi:hypothetical protein
MGVGTPISMDEYLRTSFHPDCDFVDGEVVERNVGLRRHGYAQAQIATWFYVRADLQSLTGLRMLVAPNRVRLPDIAVKYPAERKGIYRASVPLR